ncbi:MAG TPA: LysM peptidoglycan-binding domain-containing protein [Gemmataceae bacterium]|nr:LysM peptidoglycan-binding domain-containing protein [Gemmataceae bacterium]
MPNDAKLGLVVGVGLVITVAVVFFHKDLATAQPQDEDPPAAAVGTAAPAAAAPRGQYRSVKAHPAARIEGAASGRRHTVKEGETLVSLAQHYYGDGDKSDEIYRANQEVLKTPDDVPPGTELIIPELQGSPASAEPDSGS